MNTTGISSKAINMFVSRQQKNLNAIISGAEIEFGVYLRKLKGGSV